MRGIWRDAPLETTQLGYTLKSQDRLWAIVSVDDFTDPDDPSGLYGNWLWLTEQTDVTKGPVSCYDLWDDVLVWDRVHEARAYRDNLPEAERWHTLNIGDEARYERAFLQGIPFWPKENSLGALRLKYETCRRVPSLQRFAYVLHTLAQGVTR